MEKIELIPGQTLWEALAQQDIVLDRPCNGRGTCGRCRVYVEGIGQVKSCQFTRPGKYEVRMEDQSEFDVVFAGERNEEWKKAGSSLHTIPFIAVDIGTTTVAMAAVSREGILQESFINPQRKYGADVISRIEAANSGKARELHDLLYSRLIKSFDKLKKQMNADQKPCQVYIGANTTMMHILRGFSCEGLGQAPFRPVDLDYGREFWREGEAVYEVHYLPGISTYVGADITSGIYGLHMRDTDRVTVLLDLGTNGEMAIGNRKRLVCTSAAAGPAFEGSPLAVKIHGAGILRNLHKMLKNGVMDEYGLLADAYFEEGYPADLEEENAATNGQVSTDGSAKPEVLRITQDDIREIQMAKGAIRAGIDLLLEEYQVTASQVDQVYLAGGMGYYLNPEDAIAIGLLPKEFLGKTKAVGNSCLKGIFRLAGETGQEEMCKLQKIAGETEEIILSNHQDFEERYIMAMNFEA